MVGPINDVTEIIFGDGIRVEDVGRPFVSVKKEVKGYKAAGPALQTINTWGTDGTNNVCSPFNAILVGYGLSVFGKTECTTDPIRS